MHMNFKIPTGSSAALLAFSLPMLAAATKEIQLLNVSLTGSAAGWSR